LRLGGARIVEGPGTPGILGVTPVGVVAGQTTEASANKQLRTLSARLRADPRVLWVQPLADEGIPADPRAPAAANREHRMPGALMRFIARAGALAALVLSASWTGTPATADTAASSSITATISWS